MLYTTIGYAGNIQYSGDSRQKSVVIGGEGSAMVYQVVESARTHARYVPSPFVYGAVRIHKNEIKNKAAEAAVAVVAETTIAAVAVCSAAGQPKQAKRQRLI